MTLSTFLQKFDLFADTPDAVEKLRELVLNLAVQGKLVSQDPNDETADVLFRRIDAEREQLVSTKQFRPRELLGPLAKEDWPFSIPESWQWHRLADLCFLITDGAHHTPTYLPSGVPFLSVKDVSGGEIDFSNTRFISEEAHIELCKRCRPERGDILFTKVGTTGIAVTVEDSREFSIFVSLALLKFSQINLDRKYLKYMLNSPFVRKQSADNTQGIGNKNLVLRLINQFSVPLPPLAEQKRIAARVDELMTLCDQLKAQEQERETRHAALAQASLARFADAPTPANLHHLFHPSYDLAPADLRRSILSLAVQGKLVSQDPSDDPVGSLLPKLAAVAVEAQDDLLPAQWLRVPLGAAGEWRGGGTPSKSRPDFWEGSVPWVSPKDMKVLRISDAQDHISEAAIEGSSVRLIPTGSILMVVRGMILARAFPVALTTREVTINQDMKALLPLEGETAEFLLLALRAFEPMILAAIERSSHGTCKLKTDVLESILIPIPPLAEQHRILAKVDTLMALVDSLESQLETFSTAGAPLLDAVVAELSSPRLTSASDVKGGRCGR